MHFGKERLKWVRGRRIARTAPIKKRQVANLRDWHTAVKIGESALDNEELPLDSLSRIFACPVQRIHQVSDELQIKDEAGTSAQPQPKLSHSEALEMEEDAALVADSPEYPAVPNETIQRSPFRAW
ncbi:MAG: hypothetical protein Q9169_005529 [Polycauliona sp. 2 TL-2023]